MEEKPSKVPIQPQASGETKAPETQESTTIVKADKTKVATESENQAITNKKSVITGGKGKSPKTLILGIIAAILALGAAAAVIFFLVWYNKPEVVAFHAISNTYKAKNIATDGTITVDMTNDKDLKSAEIKIKNNANNEPSSNSEVEIKITATDNTELNFNVGEAITKDGIIYIKIDGVEKALEKIAETTADLKPYIAAFEKSIKAADNQWWKISIPDIIKDLESKKIIKDGDAISEAYTCVVNKLTDSKTSDEIFDIYEKHQFINIEKYSGDKFSVKNGGKLYTLKIDAQKTVDFSKDFQDSTAIKDISDCLEKINNTDNDMSTSITKEDLNVSDVQKDIDELPEIILEISNWKHELRGIYTEKEVKGEDINKIEDGTEDYIEKEVEGEDIKIEDKTGNAKTRSELTFTYPKDSTVSIPEGAKSVTKLVEIVITDLTNSNLLNGEYNYNVTPDKSTSTTDNINAEKQNAAF